MKVRLEGHMSWRSAGLVTLLLVPNTVSSQSRGLERVQWLVGCWEQQSNNRRTIEIWEAPRGGVMAGGSFVVTDTSIRETEQIRLWAAGDTLIYEAHPATQARTQFRAVPVNDRELVFANPEHDFPQRVIYRRVGNDSVIAVTEGDRPGRTSPLSYTFAFKRAPCGAISLDDRRVSRDGRSASPASVETGAQCIPSKRSEYDRRTSYVAPPGPGMEQLHALARKYYPGLTRADAPARVVIGFILDSTCNVLRHSAAFTADSLFTAGTVLRTMFPDLTERPSASGIADGPVAGERRVMITWARLHAASEKRP